jgi:hypothetical protein
MQQLRKDNHYVPKLYLKQWAHNGKILTYRLLVQNENVPLWKEQSLKGGKRRMSSNAGSTVNLKILLKRLSAELSVKTAFFLSTGGGLYVSRLP